MIRLSFRLFPKDSPFQVDPVKGSKGNRFSIRMKDPWPDPIVVETSLFSENHVPLLSFPLWICVERTIRIEDRASYFVKEVSFFEKADFLMLRHGVETTGVWPLFL